MSNIIKVNKKYEITNEQYIKCNDFSDKMISSKLEYYNRGSNKSAISIQLTYSKIAEIIVENFLKEHNYTIIKSVDFKVYENEKKNFDSDIIVYSKRHNKEFKISVKLSMKKRDISNILTFSGEDKGKSHCSSWAYFISSNQSWLDVGDNNTIQILCSLDDSSNSIIIKYILTNLNEWYKDVMIKPSKESLINKCFLSSYLLNEILKKESKNPIQNKSL